MAIFLDGSERILGDDDDNVLVLASDANVDGRGGDDWLAHSFSITQAEGESLLVSSGLYGGDGNDSIHSTLSAFGGGYARLFTHLYGGDGDDQIWLNAVVDGGSAEAYVTGDTGNDRIRILVETTDGSVPANLSTVASEGGAGDDRIAVELPLDGGTAVLRGDAGNDRISVIDGMNNELWGNQGDDTLIGGNSVDRLIGGHGADLLRGNEGADTFEFWGARGLSSAERDRIADFEIGNDLIDVSRIDANVFRSGNQAFRFNADPDDWQGTGRLWVEDNPDNDGSIVYASTGRKMFAVNLMDGADVHASDYSAGDFIL